MNGHPQFVEEFDLFALGALDREEAQHLEAHLKVCPECRRELDEARGRMALLALAAPFQEAPGRVKEKLLSQIGGRPAPQLRPWSPAIWRWAVAALASVSLVLAVYAARLSTNNDELSRSVVKLEAERQRLHAELTRARAVADLLTAPDTSRVTLVSGEARPAPQGKAFYHPQRGLIFYAANLPALPSGKTYQLWLVPAEGNPLSAGTFQTDPRGNGEVVLPPLPTGVAAKAFAVTVEPGGGVPQPTGPKVLIGLVS